MSDDQISIFSTVVPLEEYTHTEILGDGPDPFQVAEHGMVWRPKDLHFGIRSEPDGRLVAHAGLVVLPVSIDGSPTELVGLGGVAVAADLRGHGLARTVVDGALAHARTLGPRLAVLFCRPDKAELYARLGWQPLAGPVEVEQPTGPAVMPLRTMWFPLHDGARWPEGALRLHSLPM
ncbi:GNAT family N-acetyltransferase [Kitasatospora purpeofusca]|uniref:GNAT family N-acetyltransferase n=1 Tax=Kitasatospora purpeofusca TaxID=67352 RepID=UPI00225221BB|nr:GNAT family N-acetyltransferase [Kitasatospora purpeofusca]MCX4758448.1 GNAT family N-acetyltransferase [Kitasatospora purpeofusca]WSR31101.1 GNAT family N-acetyltransferase [Kitasatospora purpeofusca]WSR39136.1 GNAT family N-acetyltransferase [Kitasatospora purpeofusca]